MLCYSTIMNYFLEYTSNQSLLLDKGKIKRQEGKFFCVSFVNQKKKLYTEYRYQVNSVL